MNASVMKRSMSRHNGITNDLSADADHARAY